MDDQHFVKTQENAKNVANLNTRAIIKTWTKTWEAKTCFGCSWLYFCFFVDNKRIFWVHFAYTTETIWLNYNCINSLSIWYLANIWCKKWSYWFQYDDCKKQIFVKTNCIVIRKSLVNCKYLLKNLIIIRKTLVKKIID